MIRAFLALLVVAFVFTGCERNKALDSKLASLKAADNEAEKARVEKERKAAELKAKKGAEAEEKAAAESARLKALMPPGNRAPDNTVALTPLEKRLLVQLTKAERFMKVAKHPKVKAGKLQAFLLRALTHHNSNVRTQAPRAFIINKVHNDEVTNAWIAALKNEASSIVLENWAYDLRLYKDEAVLPALHRAFKVAQTDGARGNIAETLMAMAYEPSRADIHQALDATHDIMGKVYLISALKRLPSVASKAVVGKYVNHDNKLLAQKARECLGAIDVAEIKSGKKN